MEIRNYKQAINYLEGFIGKVIFRVNKKFLEKHDPLERMRIFLSFLGNPQEKFKSVLVGGTSGKGSTSYLISHMLTMAGYKTGLTLSPHLQKVNERLQINGKEISDKEFTKLTASMIRIIEAMKKMKIGEPSYFEILIGMAFTYFSKEKVDIAVVEVGMGGEFDATNTLNPLIAVLTNVSLDHTQILGKTVEQIARTKAGIIKGLRIKDKGLINHSSFIINHLSVISGVKQPSVIKIVEEKCKEIGAKLYRLHKDFELTNLKVSLLGEYQKENASLAIEVTTQLRKFGFKVSEENIKRALSTAFFPGRFEVLRLASFAQVFDSEVAQTRGDKTSATLVLDGAHNPTKMKGFLKSLKKLFPKEKKLFVIGFKFDKDIPKMLREITKIADKIIVTEFNRATDMNMRASANAFKIKNQISSLRQGFGRQAKIKKNMSVIVEKDSKKAIKKAINLLKTQYPNDPKILVVTGSLYLVGEIKSVL